MRRTVFALSATAVAGVLLAGPAFADDPCPYPGTNCGTGGGGGTVGTPTGGGGTTTTAGGSGSGTTLPFTGAETLLLGVVGLGAVAGGSVLVAAGRKRRPLDAA